MAKQRKDEFSGKSVAEIRDALTRNLIRPLDMVLLTRERIQEVADDAVRRGRMTADDAEDLVRGLLDRGRRQTDDVLGNLESLLGRARRVAGRGGGAFPIDDYDELTAAEIRRRLGSLGPAELRKVRDYERRNANRKSVLGAIEKKLS